MNAHVPLDCLRDVRHAGPNRHCRVCGRPLTQQQAFAGGVCDSLSCKGPYLQELKAAETARNRADRVAVAEHVQRQLDMADRSAVVVPANIRPCVPLSPERLEDFRSHLRRVIGEAQPPDDSAGEMPQPPRARPLEELPPMTVLHACTTCRGRCCLGGAGHAFLRAQTITDFWQRHSSLSQDAIEAEYLAHAAPRGYADSCVYHSESGCSLPRDMRADICNSFHCEGLRQGLETEPGPSLFIAADGTEVERVVLVATDGHRVDLLPEQMSTDYETGQPYLAG